MTTYDVGDRVRIEASFTNLSGTAADPTTVAVTVTTPGRTTVTPTVTKDSTGEYHADVDVDRPGEWIFRWTGVGALMAAESGSFYVRRS